MQALSNYLSTYDWWALAIIAVVVVILAANCSYQKRRTLARDRIEARVAPPGPMRARDAGPGMAARA